MCHHLLTLMLFQTCMRFFQLSNTKEDILKNVGNQPNSWRYPLTFIVWKKNTKIFFMTYPFKHLISILQHIFPLPVLMESWSLRQSFIYNLLESTAIAAIENKALSHSSSHTATNTTISISYSTRPNHPISYIHLLKLSLIHRKQHIYGCEEFSFSALLHTAAFVR